MSDLYATLARRYSGLLDTLGFAPAFRPDPRDLLARYDTPARHYHTLEHVAFCFMALDDFLAHNPRPENLPALDWALFYHDAIYAPGAPHNEEKSADLALQVLHDFNIGRGVELLVRSLILATRHDKPPSGELQQLIVDVDLSILGAEAESFAAYDVAVRREYAHIPLPAYRTGRAHVLRHFLACPSLFATPYFRSRYESQARTNLQQAIDRLSA